MNNDYFNGMNTVINDGTLSAGLNKFMTKVFGLMFLGLLVTAGTALAAMMYIINNMETFNPVVYWGCAIAALVLAMVLSGGINRISIGVAHFIFFIYAAINGVWLSFVLLAYAGSGAVFTAFIMAAIFFAVMAVFGLTTQADLTSAGKIFMAGLIAIIIASVVNIFFLRSDMLDTIICIAGIGIFAGLTAYDTKRLKDFYLIEAQTAGAAVASKVAILGALKLYLDFINLFLFLLRILGRKR